jgi:hypothetical protein
LWGSQFSTFESAPPSQSTTIVGAKAVAALNSALSQ